MELVFWYEFLMRALYKNKRVFVIPKVGYYHLVNRPECMTNKYAETMSEKEVSCVICFFSLVENGRLTWLSKVAKPFTCNGFSVNRCGKVMEIECRSVW